VCVCVYTHTHTHTHRSVVQRLDMNNFGASTEMEGYEEGMCAGSHLLSSSPHTNPGIVLSLSLSLSIRVLTSLSLSLSYISLSHISLSIRVLTSLRGHLGFKV